MKSRLVRAAAVAALVAFVGSSLTEALHRSHSRLRLALRYAGEDADASISRKFPPAFLESIWRIRQAIPKDGSYVLVLGEEGPARFFVRFALAPRRARYAGRLDDGAPGLRQMGEDRPRLAVIARLATASELVESKELEHRLAAPAR